MVNSSPDYAITKPGVRPLSRKRDKPLRTYGRQPTATPEPRSEPQAKRVRTTYAVHHDKNIKPLGITPLEDDAPTVAPIFKPKPQPSVEEDQENTPPSKPEPNVPAKRSILNYFKPVTTHLTQIKPTKTNIKPVAEPAEEKLAQAAPRPKRRLLRIRSQSIESDDETEKGDDSNAEQGEDEPRPTRKRRLGGGGLASSDSRRVRRKPASAEVQTTLNISNQAPFSECKICDTVWNPLYPDDVKYHTKRHAAHLRAKKKREDDDF
ncbi:hypothetical protein NLG97_g2762 [Lecanicillium saksenae]|uniref:Uncharacterized protein n=1 Tax=Lecanicillium saksenae TaxID=468837 RepID=A0ACC1R428_9HYPO|nr:hypothetical protein NLG97_g2762 [Lecanicillium saksenae]